MNSESYEREVPSFEISFWNGKSKPFALVVPVINEGERLWGLLDKMNSLGIHNLADIIIVDGGSTDGSLELDQLIKVGVQSLLVKTGPGGLSAQLRCGYSFCSDLKYQGVVTIDGNGKDDPVSIPAFIELLLQGVDFIQASRFRPGGQSINTPLSRAFAIRLIHAPILSLASGFKWTDTTQGYRGYSMKLLNDRRLDIYRDVFQRYEMLPYLNLMAPRLKFRVRELATSRSYPAGSIPTKIEGFSGQMEIFGVLLKTVIGSYNVKALKDGER